MLHILYYLTAFFLLRSQSRAAALPQLPSPSSQLLPTTAAAGTSTAFSTAVQASLTSGYLQSQPIPSETPASTQPQNDGATDSNNRTCQFDTMQDFFDYAVTRGLNITVEVQNCQNLCVLAYGVGNPDLSGIGMMGAYTVQIILTILIGPAYRLLYLVLSPANEPPEAVTFRSFVEKLKVVQTAFSASNGAFVLASAVASLARLSQNPPIFEIAQMQAMAFLQVNSILVMLFCLIRPMSRRITRVLLYTVVFVLVLVVLALSHLSGSRRTNWKLASDGCARQSTDYDVITPVLYPSWAVAIIAVAGTGGFWLQSLKTNFERKQAHVVVFRMFMFLWILLIGLLMAGMLTGLIMMWRQRYYLHGLVGGEFEGDDWGFGQIAALFIWAPIPLEILYVVHDLAQKRYPNKHYLINPGIRSFLPRKAGNREQTALHGSQNEDKDISGSEVVTEVSVK
ncbi:hypothetical protein GJ744_010611 [Endocarpon pusillum]|uniref:Integral membrane protein n=1 Tax=Endocarpon pusillum TaxID=364733 RepID=A0A8H7AY22_9EURO|nr:hypothetical protein GJ744_010611 [Endocarpon pusillum]